MTHTINVNYEGLKLEVEFDYQPAEKPTHDYPGCSEEVELTEVLHKNEDILPMLSDDAIEKISRTVIRESEQENAHYNGHFYRVLGAAA